MKKPFIAAAAMVACAVLGQAATPKFFPDDPIAVDPETQDASKVGSQDLSDPYDFLENTFMNPADSADVRAMNVNTLDEVPDSSWWTNRVLHREMSTAEIARGSMPGTGPADGIWTIVASKNEGITPGLTIRSHIAIAKIPDAALAATAQSRKRRAASGSARPRRARRTISAWQRSDSTTLQA